MDDPTNNVIISAGLKIAGYFMTFVGGIVTTTWAVAVKVRGFQDRLDNVEKAQARCQVETLGRLDKKLDFIIEEGFPAVHSRIDAVLLKDK